MPRPDAWAGYYFATHALLGLPIVTVAQFLTCSMVGYAFGRLHYFGRDSHFGLFLASLSVQATMTLIPSFVISHSLSADPPSSVHRRLKTD